MNTATDETVTTEKPKATKKARVRAQGAHVAPKKGKAAKKASTPKKAPKAQKEAGEALRLLTLRPDPVLVTGENGPSPQETR